MPSLYEIPNALIYKDISGKNIVTEVTGSSLIKKYYFYDELDDKGNKRNVKHRVRILYDSIQVFKDDNNVVKIIGNLNTGIIGIWKYSGNKFVPENDVNKEVEKYKEYLGFYEPYEPAPVPGHTKSICYLNQSKNIAMAMTTGHIALQNIASINNIEKIYALNGHTDIVSSVCYLGDGKLASASWDKTVRLWEWKKNSRKCLRVLSGHKEKVWSVCYLGNGQLASGSSDRTIRIWDINTGNCLRVLREVEGHLPRVTSLCALEKGFLASVSDLVGNVLVWNINTGKCLHVLGNWGEIINSLCYLGNWRLASASRHTIRVWDLNNKIPSRNKLLKLIFPWYGKFHYGEIKSIQAIPDTNKILILRYPYEYNYHNYLVLNHSFINICDITDLKNFPKPDRSGIFHKIQKFFSPSPPPPPRMGGRLSRKKRMVKRKSRKLKNLGDKNNFK